MKLVSNPEALTLSDTVVCIGAFDGVHLGHRTLLNRMKLIADEGFRSVVITFDPPPKAVFQGRPYLTSLPEKVELLQAFQPTAVVAIPFSQGYAQTPKETFLGQLAALKPHTIIVGEDFRFGFGRSGTLNDLSFVSDKLEVFGMKHLGDEAIKSSRILALLGEGDVEAANRFLGYSYLARGEVIEGDKRGRTIGFPTANLRLPPEKALPLGVFAVTVTTDTGLFGGMANVGSRPSYPDAPPSLEVHLFGFEGDLYGQNITVAFEHFLRHQRKFAGLGDLKAQLSRDKAEAKTLLGDEVLP